MRTTAFREWRAWLRARQRCSDPNNSEYHRYGARGIKFCERWLTFDNFLADMGPRPGPGYSIDRIDNDGDYEPGNCRWATAEEQTNNRRCTEYATYNGREMPIGRLAKETGVPYGLLRLRLVRGWEVERAVTTPKQQHQRRSA